MTFIQQFIEKALVGGWQPADRDFSIIGFYERHFEYQLQSTVAGRPSAIRFGDPVAYGPKTAVRLLFVYRRSGRSLLRDRAVSTSK